MAEPVLRRQPLHAADRILEEGGESYMADVVHSGEIEFFKDISGKEVVPGGIGEGAFFREMAPVDAKPRMASARASRGSTVIVVTRAIVGEKLEKSEPFIRGPLNVLVDNIHSMNE